MCGRPLSSMQFKQSVNIGSLLSISTNNNNTNNRSRLSTLHRLKSPTSVRVMKATNIHRSYNLFHPPLAHQHPYLPHSRKRNSQANDRRLIPPCPVLLFPTPSVLML